MESRPLFRSDALANQAKSVGNITLVHPVSFFLLTCFAIFLSVGLIVFLELGQYTSRSTVKGLLVPNLGVLKVFSPQSGLVVKKLVVEGEQVKKGDVLYVVSSDRQSNTLGRLQESVSKQVELRRQTLLEELTRLERLRKDERVALQHKVIAVEAELSKVTQQIAGQKSRVQLADAGLARLTQLMARGYVSADARQQKQADLLDQQSRLDTLERDKIGLERELQSQRTSLETLPLRQLNEIGQVKRLLASTEQELAESETKRRVAIVAPEDGTATGVTVEAGQSVENNRALLSIMPRKAILQAHLYVPSRAIGFVRQHDKVLLRYQSYPYQKFGHATGTVLSISKMAIPPNEVPYVSSSDLNSEPAYLITVKLTQQTVTAYGKPEPLQAGMLLEADILQETRKLYEWVLEPLYSLTGKL